MGYLFWDMISNHILILKRYPYISLHILSYPIISQHTLRYPRGRNPRWDWPDVGWLQPEAHSTVTIGGRQQFLTKLTEQEFSSSWKKRETFSLLSMRSSLPVAAAAGSGSASEEAAARLLAAAERLGLGAASRPSSAASSRRPSDNFKFKSS